MVILAQFSIILFFLISACSFNRFVKIMNQFLEVRPQDLKLELAAEDHVYGFGYIVVAEEILVAV